MSLKSSRRRGCVCERKAFFVMAYPLLMLQLLGDSLFGPLGPSILENFVSQNFPNADGNQTILVVNGVTAGVGGVITAVATTLFGSLSDVVGRKPFIIVSLVLASTQYIAVLFARKTLWIYIILSTINGLFGSTYAFLFSFIADTVSTKWRTIAFGLLNACFGVGFMGGSYIAEAIFSNYSEHPTTTLLIIVLSLYAFAVVYACIIPESKKRSKAENEKRERLFCCCKRKLASSANSTSAINWNSEPEWIDPPTEEKKRVSGKGSNSTPEKSSIREKMKLAMQVPGLPLLLTTSLLLNMSEMAIIDQISNYIVVLFPDYYTNARLSVFFIVLGASVLFGQVVLLPILTRFIRDEIILCFCLFFNIVHLTLYSVAWAPYVPYIAVAFSAIGNMSYTLVTAIVSKRATKGSQGSAIGLMSGVRSVASSVAPIWFGFVADAFLGKNPPFPFVGFPFVICIFLLAIAWVLSILIAVKRNVHRSLAEDLKDREEAQGGSEAAPLIQ
mmetsp:Transcript_5686/g.13298  ORF Transcript_5686/g.13298 Transcript_5686/m.13298 type:complete len:501 (-) Transcript_5686:303-1805(-)|eukprot:CAMPEP_0113909990 /NCGR_PEP_ID=MMETSP0780_2-20120614/27223_1 /TAXON_ID=652834 /ORGANISM="Palpitomonas bilix" /LENGTH=500 /DNA_ID=CAMNT_0000905989 /DNA_START=86 /DNA_END=1588 /DNA_ORIENTATION=- /assembly_acc=CAM_ASM_000599